MSGVVAEALRLIAAMLIGASGFILWALHQRWENRRIERDWQKRIAEKQESQP